MTRGKSIFSSNYYYFFFVFLPYTSERALRNFQMTKIINRLTIRVHRRYHFPTSSLTMSVFKWNVNRIIQLYGNWNLPRTRRYTRCEYRNYYLRNSRSGKFVNAPYKLNFVSKKKKEHLRECIGNTDVSSTRWIRYFPYGKRANTYDTISFGLVLKRMKSVW